MHGTGGERFIRFRSRFDASPPSVNAATPVRDIGIWNLALLGELQSLLIVQALELIEAIDPSRVESRGGSSVDSSQSSQIVTF